MRISTTLGNIDVRMFDTATPQSVQNFLNYVNDGDLVGSFFHRAPLQPRVDAEGEFVRDNEGQIIFDTFVVQGGGFTYTDEGGLGNVPTDPPVVNEPGLTNLPGTIAYAKVGGNPNSATSGFFFNTIDNSENLDAQNGGFTVFARIVRGESVLNAIAALDKFDVDGQSGSTFDNVPLLNNGGSLENNLIYVTGATVLGFSPGDYTLNGTVDSADLARWQSHYGASLRIEDHANGSPITLMAADGNGDGVVDAADYTIWRDAYGSASAAVAAPEPSAAMMLAAASVAAAARRRSR
ncbi:peptidylprolyl isomerase [Botrimarina sp.]|uniref:peptidylprolyl isomerase n=1 Tax=Botrimarina sp. TaxID=2795802 RepID=UPI0032ED6E89